MAVRRTHLSSTKVYSATCSRLEEWLQLKDLTWFKLAARHTDHLPGSHLIASCRITAQEVEVFSHPEATSLSLRAVLLCLQSGV